MSDAERLTSIWLAETNGVARVREPIRIGVPFPRGMLARASECWVFGPQGEAVLHQTRALAFWPDGSVKWLLVDALVSIAAWQRLELRLRRGNPCLVAGSQCLAVRSSGDSIRISTGLGDFGIDARSGGVLASARVGDSELIAANGSGISLRATSRAGCAPIIQTMEFEESGPFRATVRLDGIFPRAKQGTALALRTRLSFFAGSAFVRQEVLVRNPHASLHPGGMWDLGDPGSFRFTDLSLNLNCCASIREIAWSIGGAEGMNTGAWTDLVIHQDSSGGENWDSPNHVDAAGRLTVSRRGYRVTAAASQASEVLAEGKRASPVIQAITDSGWVAAAPQGFWQNFPKALRVESDTVSVGLFPQESEAGYELQGGEQKRHVLWLEFGLPGERSTVSALHNPLAVSLDPDWVEGSQAVPWFVAATDDEDTRCRNYVASVIDGPNSFFRKREQVDEYGWRHFGDLYADHEAVRHQGPKPLVSHYNNQYDFVFGAVAQYLRTGGGDWRELMEDAARHTTDIDIYHTAEDRAAYSGGLFWHTDHYKDAATCGHRTYSRHNGGRGYGGGPSNEHNYTSGLLYYYYLSGDPEAAAAVRELADWVIAMDDGAGTLLGLVDAGPTGLSSRTVDDDYHGPGRGAGNSINALLDAYRLAGERHYLVKAEELVQRCIHPADDIDQRELDEPEYRWSYLVFLQVLGKYLAIKHEFGELDYVFHYARESLLHYARWMLRNEVPYKDVLHKVLIPSETWPAHDIRKCHVFHLAAQWSAREEKESFSERAGFFFERCLGDLLSFETAYLTRPLVILSVHGHAHSFYRRRVDGPAQDWRHNYAFGEPTAFVPQAARAKSELRRKVRVAVAEIRRLLRDKVWDLWRHVSAPK